VLDYFFVTIVIGIKITIDNDYNNDNNNNGVSSVPQGNAIILNVEKSTSVSTSKQWL